MQDLTTSSVDRLVRYGILDGSTSTRSTQPQSVQYQETSQIPQDEYVDVFDTDIMEKNSKMKTYGAIALVTYLAGVVCSKGKLNPLEGMSSLYDVAARLVGKICGLFKKS